MLTFTKMLKIVKKKKKKKKERNAAASYKPYYIFLQKSSVYFTQLHI